MFVPVAVIVGVGIIVGVVADVAVGLLLLWLM